MRHFFVLIIVSFLLFACESDNNERSQNKGRTLTFTNELSFLNETMEEITTIQIALADTPNKRNLGLMDVHNLPADAGMLFIFDEEETRSFWMANTPLSLDIIYVNSDREIVRIHQNTTPYSEDQILSDYPAIYVVEVNGGFTQEHDIREGMFVDF